MSVAASSASNCDVPVRHVHPRSAITSDVPLLPRTAVSRAPCARRHAKSTPSSSVGRASVPPRARVHATGSTRRSGSTIRGTRDATATAGTSTRMRSGSASRTSNSSTPPSVIASVESLSRVKLSAESAGCATASQPREPLLTE